MNEILAFDDPQAAEVAVSGGKGAQLARAAQVLPVPPGLVVGSAVYRGFIAPLRTQISSILAEHAHDHAAASERIRALVLAQPLPGAAMEALADRLAGSDWGVGRVAVRSSGTLEDLPGAAFAGQHDTFLGVRGVEAIARAVQGCYASLWNAHVLPYRERMGLWHLDAEMAVVIQAMVEVGADEAAGVAFSIDPVRGALDEVLINAAFGLGETVVSGEAPVDEYRCRRGDFTAVAETIADKPMALVTHGESTRAVALDPAQAGAPALTADQRVEVARLAVAAEEHFGFPQDIEWAWHGGKLFLLQSRPVTRVPARWTRDESAERFPNAVTPLSWDLCEAGFHASLNYSFKLMGLPAFGDKWFAMRDYYIYGNQNAVELYAGRTPVGMLKDVDSIRAALPQIARQFSWVQELPVRWMRDLDGYLIEIGALGREPLRDRSLQELWEYVQRVNALGTEYFLPNIAISLTQRLLYAGLQQMLRLALPEDRAQEVFDRLLAVTHTKTGQVNAELWALSRRVREDVALRELFETLSGTELVDGLAEFAGFDAQFQAFLGRHGHRELDFDAYIPTWCEAPHTVLDQVRLLAGRADEDRAGEEQARKVAQAEMEHLVLTHAPDGLRYLVQEVIHLARAYTALDDLEHYQTTRLIPPLRRGLRALGGKLVEAGVLDAPMDVFFAPFEILDEAIRSGELAPVGPAVARHKAGYQAALQRMPDWVHGESDDGGDLSGDVMTGLAGSPGRVEGEVFVVRGPEDFPRFPKQAILVARTTNPAWTALFYQASGVITESGGPLSHGAVTARELGLPAVMSVRNAMEWLDDGQRVRVDGARGTVEKLSG